MTARTSYTPGTSSIDITAPGGIDALLDFHRATFGDARMDANGTGGDSGQGGDSSDGQGPQNSGQGEAGDQAGGQGSGDAGNGPQNGTGEAGGTEAQNVDQLPDWAQKVIRDTRAEAASHRTKANDATTAQQQTLDAIATALGLKQDGDGAPTVESLTEQLTTEKQTTEAAQATARQATVELAVYRGADKHSGDPAALLDSRAFLEKVTALDPTAEDFGTKVDAAIKTAVDANPKLKTGQAPARSGQDFTGGTGEGRTRTPQSLTDAVASAYGN